MKENHEKESKHHADASSHHRDAARHFAKKDSSEDKKSAEMAPAVFKDGV